MVGPFIEAVSLFIPVPTHLVYVHPQIVADPMAQCRRSGALRPMPDTDLLGQGPLSVGPPPSVPNPRGDVSNARRMAESLSPDELRQLVTLLRRFASYDLDQWELWRASTPHGEVFIKITRALPEGESPASYVPLPDSA